MDTVRALEKKGEDLSDEQRREVELAKRDLDKTLCVPRDEYVEYVKLLELSQRVWEDAKEKSDYALFKPYLGKIIDAKKRMIAYRNQDKAPYDVCLDDFEEGMDMKGYDAFFDTLKKDLVPFVKETLEHRPTTRDIFSRPYEKDKQKAFVEYLMDVFGYDKDAGGLKESVHPFTWHTHSKDVRFTVRYLEDYLPSSIFAGIHELGHALYEQNVDASYDTSALGGGASMAMHESQSRFYENVIGRSRAFWERHFPRLRATFPEQLGDVDATTFHRAVNDVAATFIRVEADELTYASHIMVRYDIERMIFNDEATLDDLPELWNRSMKETLGVDVEKDSDGILQDVHWSFGAFGYFPTYALGSAIAAQLRATMNKDFDLETLIGDGDIGTINAWLKEKMHRFGKRYTPGRLLMNMTGEPFDASHYIRYLKEKFTKLQ